MHQYIVNLHLQCIRTYTWYKIDYSRKIIEKKEKYSLHPLPSSHFQQSITLEICFFLIVSLSYCIFFLFLSFISFHRFLKIPSWNLSEKKEWFIVIIHCTSSHTKALFKCTLCMFSFTFHCSQHNRVPLMEIFNIIWFINIALFLLFFFIRNALLGISLSW